MAKQKIIVFSGAGISAESGLGTFRDSGGLWEKYNIEEVATPEAWERDPAMVTEFYNMRRKQCYETSPNAAHYAIAELEKQYRVEVITQNIDDLHERAGSPNVTHLHGEISKVKSSGPNAEKQYFPQGSWDVEMGEVCPEGYQARPHVVWASEGGPMLDKGIAQIEEADIVNIVGTSLNVCLAAVMSSYAQSQAMYYLS